MAWVWQAIGKAWAWEGPGTPTEPTKEMELFQSQAHLEMPAVAEAVQRQSILAEQRVMTQQREREGLGMAVEEEENEWEDEAWDYGMGSIGMKAIRRWG